MQTHPANWDSLLVSKHIVQYRFTVNGIEYPSSYIKGTPTIEKPLMLEPVIGRCCTGSLTVMIRRLPGVDIPKAAPVTVDCRLAAPDESVITDWIPQGRYWITKRSGHGELVSLTCRDAMVFAGQSFADKTTIRTWPATMSAVLTDAARIIGVEIDERTQINTGAGYTIAKPGVTVLVSDVLCEIAAAHGGNFIMTERGKLRLVPFPTVAEPTSPDVKKEYKEYTPYSTGQKTISRVTLKKHNGDKFTYGDDTGVELVGECDTATQTMVNELGSSLSGRSFTPYRMTNAYVDPCMELGDTITATCGGQSQTLIANSILATCSSSYTCEVENGVGQDDEEEIHYETPQEVKLARASSMGYRNGEAIADAEEKIKRFQTAIEQTDHKISLIATETDLETAETVGMSLFEITAQDISSIVKQSGTVTAEFSKDVDYKAGDRVLYNGTAYRFKEDHDKGDWIGTDVEVVSDLQSQISQTATDLTSEIIRATTVEGTLTTNVSVIKQTADSVSAEVRAARDGKTDLKSRIDAEAGKIALVVSSGTGGNTVNTASIIAAINGGTGHSEVAIEASKVLISGETTVSGMFTIGDGGALRVLKSAMIGSGDNYITIGNGSVFAQNFTTKGGGYVRIPDASGAYYDLKTNLIKNLFKDATVNGNTLTLTRVDGTKVDFSKAAPTTNISGSWSGNTFNVTADPNGTATVTVTITAEEVGWTYETDEQVAAYGNEIRVNEGTTRVLTLPLTFPSITVSPVLTASGGTPSATGTIRAYGPESGGSKYEVDSTTVHLQQYNGYVYLTSNNNTPTIGTNVLARQALPAQRTVSSVVMAGNPQRSGAVWNDTATVSLSDGTSSSKSADVTDIYTAGWTDAVASMYLIPTVNSDISEAKTVRMYAKRTPTAVADVIDDVTLTPQAATQRTVSALSKVTLAETDTGESTHTVTVTYDNGETDTASVTVDASNIPSPSSGSISIYGTDQGDPDSDVNPGTITARATGRATKSASLYITQGSWKSDNTCAVNIRLGSNSGTLIARMWITGPSGGGGGEGGGGDSGNVLYNVPSGSTVNVGAAGTQYATANYDYEWIPVAYTPSGGSQLKGFMMSKFVVGTNAYKGTGTIKSGCKNGITNASLIILNGTTTVKSSDGKTIRLRSTPNT